jgi:hypothetical protein
VTDGAVIGIYVFTIMLSLTLKEGEIEQETQKTYVFPKEAFKNTFLDSNNKC